MYSKHGNDIRAEQKTHHEMEGKQPNQVASNEPSAKKEVI